MASEPRKRQALAGGLIDAPLQPYWCRVDLVAIDLACGDVAAAALEPLSLGWFRDQTAGPGR